ncbi:MAG TPA: hypothetical protein VGO40_04240, partial [Longimicrobium sp.]|nr:hypothetical protein [Longimicrobium sp.]
HGSLYDRAYRVKLRVAPSPAAPLFRVAMRRGEEAEPELFQAPRRQPEPTPEVAAGRPAVSVQVPSGPSTATIAAAAAAGENATIIAPEPAASAAPPPSAPAGPSIDPDATRLDGAPIPSAPEAPESGFDAGRFVLAVEDEEGTERERFPVPGATTTVGRQTENPDLRSDVAITDAPHVSRRQLVLVWAPREEQPGFTVYNVGLNPMHVGDREVAGANRKGEVNPDELPADNSEWVAPGSEMMIGEHGPVLRIVDTRPAEDEGAGAEEAPEVEIDPDATRFG